MAKRLFGLKKKQANSLIMAAALALIVFTGFSGVSVLGGNPPPAQQPVSAPDVQAEQVATDTAPAAPTTEAPTVLYKVAKVVDGDTIDVTIDGKSESVRILGVNTPETVDPRKPVECFGKEASDHAKTILSGGEVGLVADRSQGDKDKYGRLLRYVLMPDGTDFGLTLIEDGYAYEYTYDKPYDRQAEYKAAQAEAQANLRGLWSPSTCDGKLTATSTSA